MRRYSLRLGLTALVASFALGAVGRDRIAAADEGAKGVLFEGVDLPFSDVKTKAKDASKPIFIDFLSDG